MADDLESNMHNSAYWSARLFYIHTDIKIYIQVNSANITKLINDFISRYFHIRLYIRRNNFEKCFVNNIKMAIPDVSTCLSQHLNWCLAATNPEMIWSESL